MKIFTVKNSFLVLGILVKHFQDGCINKSVLNAMKPEVVGLNCY